MRGEGFSENKGCPFKKEERVCQRDGLAVSLQTVFQKSQEVFACIPPESSLSRHTWSLPGVGLSFNLSQKRD